MFSLDVEAVNAEIQYQQVDGLTSTTTSSDVSQ